MPIRAINRCRQAGMSIVELMVAVLISTVLMAGIIQLFVSNKATYEVTDELSRLQENARFALEAMAKDLRMTGYFGCMEDVDQVFNHVNDPGDGSNLFDTSTPIQALEEDGTAWTPAGVSATTTLVASRGGTTIGDLITGTDAFAVRYIDGGNEITIATPYMPTTAGNIQTSVSTLVEGEIVAISDCSSADIFQITNPTGGLPGTTGVLVHNTGTNTPGNATKDLSKVYEGDASVSRLIARRWYIGQGDRGPSLFRQGISTTSPSAVAANTEIVEGVENMQITFGEDTSGNRIANVYRDADNVANWDNVVSVKIGLLLRTLDEVRRGNDLDVKTYTVNATTIDPVDDGRYRRVFHTTVLMRNLQR